MFAVINNVVNAPESGYVFDVPDKSTDAGDPGQPAQPCRVPAW